MSKIKTTYGTKRIKIGKTVKRVWDNFVIDWCSEYKINDIEQRFSVKHLKKFIRIISEFDRVMQQPELLMKRLRWLHKHSYGCIVLERTITPQNAAVFCGGAMMLRYNYTQNISAFICPSAFAEPYLKFLQDIAPELLEFQHNIDDKLPIRRLDGAYATLVKKEKGDKE